jgi:hypothetical protein
MKKYSILCTALALFISPVFSQTPPENEIFGYVTGIEGKDHHGRGEFVKEKLREMDVGYTTAPFRKTVVRGQDTTIVEGENIIARLGRGDRRIIVGAHYDAYPNSPGANDNGSGVAVMLELIKSLHDTAWNYTVDFCFFDQEEAGRIGSYYYIKQFVMPKRHLVMINLDVVGLGDEIYAGPVGENSRTIMRYVNEAAKKNGYNLSAQADYPVSDFAPFAELHLENISISMVPMGESERLAKMIKEKYTPEMNEEPRIFGLMHTPYDSSGYISKFSLKISYEFARTLLLLLNEAQFTEPVELPKDKNAVRRK